MTGGGVYDEVVRQLRAVILAGEDYRQALARATGLGVTETQALSYLAIYGERGQTDLASDLGITTGAATALVDRLERQEIAERFAHPSDRRRLVVRLRPRGRAIIEQSRRWLTTAFQQIPAGELATLSRHLQSVATDLRLQSIRVRTGEVALDAPARVSAPRTPDIETIRRVESKANAKPSDTR